MGMTQQKIAEMQARARTADVYGSGSYINPGQGELIVKSIKMIPSTNRKGEVDFIAENIVDECTPYNGLKDAAGNPKPEGNVIGSTVSVVCKTDSPDEQEKKRAWSDMIKYLQGVTGKDQNAVADLLPTLLSEQGEKDQPLRGRRFKYETYEKPTRDEKTIMTLPKFTAVAQDDATVAAVRGQLDGIK